MNVKYYRKKLGLSQLSIAKKLGISQQGYSFKEQGKVPFNGHEMLAFKLLAISVDPNATIDDIFFSDTPPTDREDVIVEKIDALIQQLETIKGGNK